MMMMIIIIIVIVIPSIYIYCTLNDNKVEHITNSVAYKDSQNRPIRM